MGQGFSVLARRGAGSTRLVSTGSWLALAALGAQFHYVTPNFMELL